ncbi:fasciclin domain-containing protein [Galbibacter mesophilus]|uniref:hypothetical protein n=1 Tax=Galbibacter mesophilus TaxID=379069 RepID=UPI00191F20A8|nr:hypothetical protein [Galbibacter mesophilus]MCM5662656.1 fasciclin domain-containing protein [Galbibacter mesophilus]
MKKITVYLLILFAGVSCTENNLIDSGIAEGNLPDKTIYQYLQSDDYNWALTVEMINHAGLTDIFNGDDPNYEEIMFMGLTSHSIRRWLYDQNLETIADTDPAICRQILLNHVFTDVYLRDETPTRQDDGVFITSIGGAEIQLFSEENIDPVYGVGPVFLKFNSADGIKVRDAQIASADIQPSNGVVHSMHYDYLIDKL